MKSIMLAILALAQAGVARDLADFEARLDKGGSATEVLRGWCAERHLADPPVIKAERDRSVDKPADADVRALLGAAPGEAIRYRRVRLACGARVLSEADNWYRPGRLTAEMNRRLDQTDTPFGAVVKPLGFHRRTLGVERPFDPKTGTAALPHTLVRYRALLLDPKETPFSLVVESYTAEILRHGD
ncbi:MAG TPA: hypothetical protein VKQ54_08305 [Caulobacteraceae bacterium]|nr:hypothetical protein [Caulobacteraceae bacterium]